MSYTDESLESLKLKSRSNRNSAKKFILKLGRLNPQKLDDIMSQLLQIEFKKIDCLKCANCCKTISPAMNESDIRRMASALKIKVSEFYSRFLNMDDEGDYVFKKTPCLFLGEDNYCSLYESRPRACMEYPHTDRKRFYQILELVQKNYEICPVVFNIIERLKKSSALK
jgi:uncharacterized protein